MVLNMIQDAAWERVFYIVRQTVKERTRRVVWSVAGYDARKEAYHMAREETFTEAQGAFRVVGRETDEIVTKREVPKEALRVVRQEAGIDEREMTYPVAGGGAPIGIDNSGLQIEKQGLRRGCAASLQSAGGRLQWRRRHGESAESAWSVHGFVVSIRVAETD
jgi:hypothetical protein